MTERYLGVPEIGELFADETAHRGGRVTDMFADERRLFARSVLAMRSEVRLGDVVESGVALRLVGSEASVRPYVFRLMCANGAIFASSDEAVHLDLADLEDPRESLRASIARCGSRDAFEATSAELRSLATHRSDTALTVMSMLVRHMSGLPNTAMLNIMEHLRMEQDRGAFGIMNAVTAVARDTRDPEDRWRLEEIGGGVPAMLLHPDRVRPEAEPWPFQCAVVEARVTASLK